MKNGPARQSELNYGLRRVVYDTMVAAKSLTSFSSVDKDYSANEMAKMSGLIMARNLNAFLYCHGHDKNDDINVTDFNLSAWQPSPKARLEKEVIKRIHKIVGHIVASKPNPFKDEREVRNIILPIIREACEFIRKCLAQEKAKYTGKASYYVPRLNGSLAELELPKLPKS